MSISTSACRFGKLGGMPTVCLLGITLVAALPLRTALTVHPTQQGPLVTTVEGREIPWTMELVSPHWMGGNYYELERMSERIRERRELDRDEEAFGAVEVFLKVLKAIAKDTDSALLNIDDFRDVLKTEYATGQASGFTVIIISYSNKQMVADFKKNPKTAWAQVSRDFVEPEYPEKSRTHMLIANAPERTGGFPTERAIFSIETPEGKKLRSVVHLVHLGPHGTHLFNLQVRAEKFEVRSAEFLEMLKTVQYNFPEVKN